MQWGIPYCKWEIFAISDGYSIRRNSPDKALAIEDGSTYNGAELTFTTDFTDLSAIWYFEQAANVPSGIMVYNSKNTVVKGDSYEITASAYSPYLTSGTVTWQSSDTSVVSLSDASGGSIIRLTKKKITGASISSSTLTITSASDSSVNKTVQIGVGEIANGTYFINSKELPNNGEVFYTANGFYDGPIYSYIITE